MHGLLAPESRDYRVEIFRDELKFTKTEAEALADAITVDTLVDRLGNTHRYESPVAITKVRRMVEQGCNHKQIVNLLT